MVLPAIEIAARPTWRERQRQGQGKASSTATLLDNVASSTATPLDNGASSTATPLDNVASGAGAEQGATLDVAIRSLGDLGAAFLEAVERGAVATANSIINRHATQPHSRVLREMVRVEMAAWHPAGYRFSEVASPTAGNGG